MKVKAKIKGKLIRGAGKSILIFGAKQLWRAMLRTTLWGDCECAVDGNPLDNKEDIPYWCATESGSEYTENSYSNSTTVSYEMLTKSIFVGKTGKTTTDESGRYSFSHKIAIGYLINVSLKSKDLHNHTSDPSKQVIRVGEYEKTEKALSTGNVFLAVVPVSWEQIQQNFTVNPKNVTDPCD